MLLTKICQFLALQPNGGTNQLLRTLLSGFLAAGGGGSSSGVTPASAAPAGNNFTDFSMFPGNTAPATGTYIALTPTRAWFFNGGDTQWRYSDLLSA